MAHYRMATCATSRPYGFAATGYDDPPRRCHQGRAAAIDRAYRGRWIAAAAVQVKLQVPPVGHQGPRQSHSLIMGDVRQIGPSEYTAVPSGSCSADEVYTRRAGEAHALPMYRPPPSTTPSPLTIPQH